MFEGLVNRTRMTRMMRIFADFDKNNAPVFWWQNNYWQNDSKSFRSRLSWIGDYYFNLG
jgi:hypothetical protein